MTNSILDASSKNVNTELHRLVGLYRGEGLSLIPIAYQSKKPAVKKWEPYQTRQASPAEISTWFNGHPTNIAVVCGPVSGGLVVVEFDNPDFFTQFEVNFLQLTGSSLFDFTRITQGKRGPHVWLRVRQPVNSAKFPTCEIRSDGNYILVPPSTHPEGPVYRFLTDLPIREIESLKEVGIDVDQVRSQRAAPLPEGQPIPEGQRNATLASLAGSMQRRGMSQEAIVAALLTENKRCMPPLPESEIMAIAKSVGRYPPNDYKRTCMYNTNVTDFNTHERYTNVTESVTARRETETESCNVLSAKILEWVKNTSAWWETSELDKDLAIASPKDKNNRRIILYRLKEQGIIEPHQRVNKQFRYVNTKVTSLQFKTATTTGVLPVQWPLGIEKYVNLFPGNIAVVAGSPNAGKTALLLNFIYLNQDSFPIYYFCSEMGAVELRDRLDKFPGMDINDWHFEAIERASDFADVIRPDCVNIVDYLEMTTELYAVNTHLTAISHKLGSGIAIVALQKKQGATFGRGQEFGLEKPKLYLSLDRNKMQIIKGKSWAKKNVDPHGLKVNFKIIGGCEFQATSEWNWEV